MSSNIVFSLLFYPLSSHYSIKAGLRGECWVIDVEEMRARLALCLTYGLGRARFQSLMSQAGNAQTVFAAGVEQWRHWGLSDDLQQALLTPDWDKVEAQMLWQQQSDQHHLCWWDTAEYPQRLKDVDDAPPLLWVRGNVAVLSDPQIALVGSRNATTGGLKTAHAFAQELAQSGLSVTSGLAGGIDAAAHEGALAVANGVTIGVVGTGVDLIYPSRNKSLAMQMLAQGAIVSEFPLGTKAQAWHFPQRNRIISGLSLGVLVIEAAEVSGSLITARMALDQGREVFAIPGSIHNPLAKGCHQLIKKGQAKLTETVADILSELSGQLQGYVAASNTVAASLDMDISEAAQALLAVTPYDPILIDALLVIANISPTNVAGLLLELEMSGSVNLIGGNRVVRIR